MTTQEFDTTGNKQPCSEDRDVALTFTGYEAPTSRVIELTDAIGLENGNGSGHSIDLL